MKAHCKSKKHLSKCCVYLNCHTSIKGNLKQYQYIDIKTIDPKLFITVMREEIRKRYVEQKWKNMKLGVSIHVEFYKQKPDGQTEFIDAWFNGGCMKSVTHVSLLDDIVTGMIGKVGECISKFTREGSGWIISKLLDFQIKMAKYQPLRASSYIPLPKKYQHPKFKLINMKNDDQECFKWCIARSDCIDQKNPQRVSEKVKENAFKYNWDGIAFPTPLNQINKFELQNSMSVSVYGLTDEKLELYPLRVSKIKNNKHVMLLLIEDEGNTHYVLMQDLSPFIDKKHKGKTYPCPYCLHSFYKKELLVMHEPNCIIHAPVRADFGASTVDFRQHCNQIKHPFVMYADFESTLQKIHTVRPSSEDSYHMNLQKHNPNSWAVYTKCEVDKYSKFEMYNGSDAPVKFVEYMIEETKRIYDLINANIPMNLTPEQKIQHAKATRCYVCHEEWLPSDWKVRDHNHLTGVYRGAAHNSCNLKIRNPKFYPVFMHNLTNYDAHLFIKEFGNVEGELKVIPQTDEKYISFSQSVPVNTWTDESGKIRSQTRELRFLDSYRFMTSSLKTLAANLPDDAMKVMHEYYPEKEHFDVLRRKGVYPYEWMDDEGKFDERQLPPIESFYSTLRGVGINHTEYQHAENVWKIFNCETFRNDHNIYLKSDVLLLADVFENFRDTCYKTYGLDPAKNFTLPGLSWCALLKHSEIKLDLIQDADMLLMVEKGIRGGVSTISHRHAKANNPYLPETYDTSKPNSYIPYLDANNLYGWAMSQYLPTGNFKWYQTERDFGKCFSVNPLESQDIYYCCVCNLNVPDLCLHENGQYHKDELLEYDGEILEEDFLPEIDVMEVSDTSCKGYILEVDLEYPSELHDLHNDYPLAPENMVLNEVGKLVPNLQNKKNYIIHYRALKQYLNMGMKLVRIHRVLEFDQSPWMKSYINLNTEMRKKATSDFEKDFYKLMNNSVFGKTMENIRKRIDVQLVKTREACQKLVNKPNFSSFKIFNSQLAAVHMKRTKLKFDKPIYVGQAVLDLSKILMYDFHYNTIKKKYGSDAQLLFTDTDSLCYHIQTEDIYEDIGKLSEQFDTSNYPTDHPIYNNVNKKILGKMKDETAGKPIEEFVGLRAKLYAYKFGDTEEKKCKGVAKNVIKTKIKLEDYRRVLFERSATYRQMITFGTVKHQIYTQEINKIALSGDDDKRVIQEDGIHTLAYGHYRLEK
jgi:hypothetical protein